MMSPRQQAPLLISWSLVLCLGLPAGAQGFKVYISTDMEGCSGVTCSEQVAGQEGKQLMTGDMNACIEGCFAAGATEVGYGSKRMGILGTAGPLQRKHQCPTGTCPPAQRDIPTSQPMKRKPLSNSLLSHSY